MAEVNNIWDFLYNRQDDQKTSMSQEVDYAEYLAQQAAINNATPTATNIPWQPEEANSVNTFGPMTPMSIPGTVQFQDKQGVGYETAPVPVVAPTKLNDGFFVPNTDEDNSQVSVIPTDPIGATPPPPVEEPGFFDKIGSGMSDFFGDEERMARMTIALNSMRLNPDDNIAKSMENKLESLRKRKGANRSVDWLRANATPQNQYAKYADLIEKNPEMASELMKQVMGIGKGGYKTSAVQIDPETGQKYVVKTNPADGSVTRVDVEGALGTTYEGKQRIASEIALQEQDTKDAYKASQEVFVEAQDMRGNIRELYKMIPLLDKGAETGLLRQYLPSFKAATAQLRTIGNKLGINVINMATFGALSEKELNLALKTAIDLSLPPAELRKQILMKIEAQENLMNELYREAQKLSSGSIGYQEYINENSKRFLRSQETRYNALTADEKQAVSHDTWMGWNLAKREKFISARSK
jgi:hypothetical protein